MDAIERRNRASREAADWWALLQGDDMTRAEREGFIDWLRDSPTNIAEMLRLSQVHGALEQFREWADISTGGGAGNQAEIIALPPQRKPAASPRGDGGPGAGLRTLHFLGFAATFAVVAFLAMFLLPQWRGEVIATERGERREVVLDDGSVVQIDPQTRLNVRFDASQRRVVLTQGRAVFRVAKNAQRPFRVEAGGTTVRAIGTAFGVDRRASDQVVITVSEGKVAVSSPNIELKPSMDPHPKPFPSAGEGDSKSGLRIGADSSLPRLRRPSSSDGEGMEVRNDGVGEVLLGANEQITVAMTRAPQPVRTVDSQRELAWAEGRLVFKNDTVAKVIAEFNRYNPVQLEVTDPTLAARPVTGVFDAANPEAFLAFIQNAAPVHVERDDGRSIVISPSVSH